MSRSRKGVLQKEGTINGELTDPYVEIPKLKEVASCRCGVTIESNVVGRTKSVGAQHRNRFRKIEQTNFCYLLFINGTRKENENGLFRC